MILLNTAVRVRSIINAMFDQKNRTLYILHVYFEGEEIIRNVNTTALYALDIDCAIVHSCATGAMMMAR